MKIVFLAPEAIPVLRLSNKLWKRGILSPRLFGIQPGCQIKTTTWQQRQEMCWTLPLSTRQSRDRMLSSPPWVPEMT